MKTITLILRNRKPVAYAKNEKAAKAMIMKQFESHPEWYKNAEDWWERTAWNVQQIYSFKEIPNKSKL